MTGTPVEFHLPIGIPLELEVHGAEVDDAGIRISATAAPEAWGFVEGGYLFHLDDAEVDGGAPPMLDDDRPVDVVLRLDDTVGASLPKSTRKADTLVHTLESSPSDSPVLDTESWFLLEARQGDKGYRTSFADAASVHRGELHLVPDAEVAAAAASSPLLQLAESFVESMDLDFERIDARTLRVPIVGDNGPYNMFVHARDEHRQITVHATWDQDIPADRRTAVMELVTRINVELTVSWFELDLDNGSVSARAGIDLEGIDANDDTLVENIFYAADKTLDRFLPALRAVALEGLDPSDIPPLDEQ